MIPESGIIDGWHQNKGYRLPSVFFSLRPHSSRSARPCFFHPPPLGYLKTKESFLLKNEFNSHRIVWYIKMDTVSLFWYTNKATLTENDQVAYSKFTCIIIYSVNYSLLRDYLLHRLCVHMT